MTPSDCTRYISTGEHVWCNICSRPVGPDEKVMTVDDMYDMGRQNFCVDCIDDINRILQVKPEVV